MPETGHEVGELLAWAAELADRGAAGLPEHVLRTALTVVCDDLGAMIGAHAEEEVRAVSAQAGGPAEATIVGVPGLRAERRRGQLD